MKRSPDIKKLESTLRSSKLVSGGFLANDARPLEEIIDSDAADVAGHNLSMSEITARMKHISNVAKAGLGTFVKIDERLEASVSDTRGCVACPWPHPGRFSKTVVRVRRVDTGDTIEWSDLNVHMIDAHGFFEGRGSAFRLDPARLIEIIFA